AGDFRPLRLGRAQPVDPGKRRLHRLGDAWARGRAGLLVPETGAGGRAAGAAGAGRRWRGGRGMKRFADLLELLALTPSRTRKIAALAQYFAEAPDPDRGLALAVLTGEMDISNVKP